MATQTHDLRGLKCPQPTLKMTVLSHKLAKGDIMEVMADCPTFESDVRNWCDRSKKTLLMMRDEGAFKRCQVII